MKKAFDNVSCAEYSLAYRKEAFSLAKNQQEYAAEQFIDDAERILATVQVEQARLEDWSNSLLSRIQKGCSEMTILGVPQPVVPEVESGRAKSGKAQLLLAAQTAK